MEKIKFILALFLVVAYIFTACSDDEEKGDAFSELTIEENKKEIETQAIALLDNMNAVADLQVFDVISKLTSNMESSSFFMEEETVVAGINMILREIEAVKSAPKASLQLKSFAVEDDSPSKAFGENTGIYTWSTELNEWRKEESATELTFKFNVEEQPALISISKFEFKHASNKIGDMSNIELPVNIKMKVTLAELVLCSFSFEGKYSSDDMPESLVEKITLEGFTLASSLKITKGSSLKSDMSFDYNGTMIYANGFEVNGKLTFDEIDGAVEGAEMEKASAMEMLENANIYFRLGNIMADAYADMVGMLNDTQNVSEITDEFTDKNVLMVDILNHNIKGFIRYADSKEVIAKSEFYAYDEEDWGAIRTKLDLKMIFVDGTSIDDSFLGKGFTDFITNANKMIDDINTNYDLELDYVE